MNVLVLRSLTPQRVSVSFRRSHKTAYSTRSPKNIENGRDSTTMHEKNLENRHTKGTQDEPPARVAPEKMHREKSPVKSSISPPAVTGEESVRKSTEVVAKKLPFEAQSVQKKKSIPTKFSPKPRVAVIDQRISRMAAMKIPDAKSMHGEKLARRERKPVACDRKGHVVRDPVSDVSVLTNIIKLCDKSFDRALHLHFAQEKPHLALSVYRTAREKLTAENCASSDALSDAFIRVDINYAKCIEDCFEHSMDAHSVRAEVKASLQKNASSSIEVQSCKFKHMWRAIQLYSEAIDQLKDRGKGSHSLRLHLRLAECYEKLGMFDKSKETIKECAKFTENPGSGQYDVGMSLFIDWNPQLYHIFHAYFRETIEKGISALQQHIQTPGALSRDAMWYANLFFARRCSLHHRRYYRQVGVAYENALCLRPNSFSVSLEYAHFLQFIQNSPQLSIKRYLKSINIMRKNLDWPGVKKSILPQALHNLANAHIALSEPEAAHPLLHEAKALYRTEKTNITKIFKIRLMLAKALEDCGDTEQALVMYTKILDFVSHGERCKTTPQIDVMNQRSVLNVGEVYCRVAVFLKSISRIEEAEQFFAKTLLHKNTELATKIECLYSYSDLLREIGDMRRANLMDDHLFSIVMQNHGSTLKLPLQSWLARIEHLDANGRHGNVIETYDFLTDKDRCSFNAAEYNEILRRYAEYLQMKGEYAAANVAYEKCIQSDPSNIYFYVQHAWCLAKSSSEPSSVERHFQKAVELYEATAEKERWDGCFCYGEFGVYLHENTRFAEAESLYTKATQSLNASKSTNYAQVCANLGILYHMQSKSELSDQWFTTAVHIRPVQYVPWLLYLDTLMSAKAITKGLKTAKRMVQLFPEHCGSVFLRMGKLLEAEKSSSPERVAYAYYMAMKSELTHSNETFSEDALLFTYKHTRNVHALAEYAATLNYKLHFYKHAEECYKILSERLPNDINIALHYGKLAFDHLDDPAMARRQFEYALQLDPSNLLAYEYLAEYYVIAESDVDAAEDCYLQALCVASAAELVHACYQYAQFLQTHRDTCRAETSIFQEIAENNPADSTALISHAIYLQLGLDERDQSIAKIKFAQQSRSSDANKAVKLSIKDYLPGKQLACHTKECTQRIEKIAGAIQTASQKEVCPETMDVSQLLRKRNSALHRKTRQSIAESMVSWNLNDFLHDPTHHFVLELDRQEAGFLLDAEQQKRWEAMLRIDKLFRTAIEVEPTNIAHLQHYGNFLSNWMMNLPEAGKVYLKAVNLQSKNADLLRAVAAFFYRHGYEHNIHSFLDIARGLYSDIIESGAHTIEDLLQYTNYLNTVQDEAALEEVYGRLRSMLDAQSAEGRSLEKILQQQSVDVKLQKSSETDDTLKHESVPEESESKKP